MRRLVYRSQNRER